MWSYYGSKGQIVDCYPKPKHDKIIEYFAGSAKYSLKWWDRDVLLVDKYEVIVNVWKWLQQCSPDNIKKLPRVLPGQLLSDFTWDCIEQRHFMGFIIQYGVFVPGNVASKGSFQRPNRINFILNKIAARVHTIKHWEIRLGDYSSVKNQAATHFIDAPYQHGGHKYIHGNKEIDFGHLSSFCQSRLGQTIVCENNKANWLPFIPMKTTHGSKGIQHECIWSNEKTSYHNIQQKLILN